MRSFCFTKRFFDVVHQDAPIGVKSMLLNVANPALMYLVVDVESHSIDEEVAPMMIHAEAHGGAVFAIDMQDDPAVKDVVKSQQWGLDVADVEPGWKTDVVAGEQDVFAAMDVNMLVGSCRKSNLCVTVNKSESC